MDPKERRNHDLDGWRDLLARMREKSSDDEDPFESMVQHSSKARTCEEEDIRELIELKHNFVSILHVLGGPGLDQQRREGLMKEREDIGAELVRVAMRLLQTLEFQECPALRSS
jgi:hypothetical protein